MKNLILKLSLPGLILLFLSAIFISCEKEILLTDEVTEIQVETRGMCTQVKPGPTVKVPIPVPPDPPTPQQILDGVRNALMQAAAAADKKKDVKTKEALMFIRDRYNLEAATGDSELLGGELTVALAFPFYYMYFDAKGKLHIIAISVQIIEEPSTPMTRNHEDGHSYISKEVAKKIAEKATQEAKKKGLKGPALVAEVDKTIKKIASNGQKAYETATNSGRKGDQAKEAKKAAMAAVKAYMKSVK